MPPTPSIPTTRLPASAAVTRRRLILPRGGTDVWSLLLSAEVRDGNSLLGELVRDHWPTKASDVCISVSCTSLPASGKRVSTTGRGETGNKVPALLWLTSRAAC